jgi:exopolyphosphatase / guanosine-5'-triphosphate,3'-diphosphate pyrophosphatase
VPQTPASDTLAAVDLGSNSFHLVVASLVGEELRIVDRRRERVALAEGLDAKKMLSAETQERSLACIDRFGERLRGIPPTSVRAVGTSALRVARNARPFLARAGEALGLPVEVISGAEEARLIYLGVAHDLSDDAKRRLVVDIGGGSTECILGERFEALRTDSLHMGCVNYSARFFPDGELSPEAMERAVIAARLEVRSLERPYRTLGWTECIGSSGTIVATSEILRENGWSESGITEKGLRRFRKAIASAGKIERLAIAGLQPERAPVIAGGVAILSAVFEGLSIDEMRVSQGALREGILYDLLGRVRHEDLRDRTIKAFGERYRADAEQAERVRQTALSLLDQAAGEWGIEVGMGRRFLEWAARLHECGLSLSYGGYHKHGAYLVEHSDMPGFSREDQLLLALLIAGQRRKLALSSFETLPSSLQKPALRLCVLFRLAVVLNRSRSTQPLPAARLSVKRGGYALEFPKGWLAENSLTLADLGEEVAHLASAGIEVDLS